MCALCITTAALSVAGATSVAGVIAIAASRIQASFGALWNRCFRFASQCVSPSTFHRLVSFSVKLFKT
jgi:hypothetical protein